MSSSSLKSKRLDDLCLLWHERVKRAQILYFHATMQHIRIAAELKQSQSGDQECEFAVAKARRAEVAALYALSRTIQIYSDLVFRGAIPADHDDIAPV